MTGGKLGRETMKFIRQEYLRKTPLSYLCVRHNELHRKCHSFVYCMCVQHDLGKNWHFWEDIALLHFKASVISKDSCLNNSVTLMFLLSSGQYSSFVVNTFCAEDGNKMKGSC